MMIKILLADDHDLFRDGLRALLQSTLVCDVLEANSYETILAHCHKNDDISLILVDLDMPGANGLEGAFNLRKEMPDTRIAVLSGMQSVPIISNILSCGFQGYIPKSLSSEIIISAIQLILAGETYIPSLLLSAFGDGTVDDEDKRTNCQTKEETFSITEREREVLALLAKGYSNKEIARELGICTTTVRTHTVSIFRTLNVSNRTQAGHIALKHDLV